MAEAGDTVQGGGTLVQRIETALEACRPALRADGGDIELVRVTEDGIAELRFAGECRDCSLSVMTLRAGVERVVMHHAPEIRRVEAVQ
jgi:Fe-S cluster biogenesis protein NfuA